MVPISMVEHYTVGVRRVLTCEADYFNFHYRFEVETHFDFGPQDSTRRRAACTGARCPNVSGSLANPAAPVTTADAPLIGIIVSTLLSTSPRDSIPGNRWWLSHRCS